MIKKLTVIFAVIALIVLARPAFAANPFMDVPAGHWAYDAVGQLAASGVISGYTDGSYKGSQPATRYEMASIVARALASMQNEKAGSRETELIKKLVLEFKNELDALGVKVKDLDSRVAVLEDNVGGWKVRGVFRFDASFSSSDNNYYSYTTDKKKNEFTKERFRLFLTKTIDENTYFYAQYRTGGGNGSNGGRGDQAAAAWTHLYLDTKLPRDIGFRVGRFAVDFEDDYGLYTDNDALFGFGRIDGFRLTKNFGALGMTAVAGRNVGMLDKAATTAGGIDYTSSDKTIVSAKYNGAGDHMMYILDLNFRPSEKFFVGATGYWGKEDSYNAKINAVHGTSSIVNADLDINTYTFYSGYSFTPSVALKGMYYFQSLGRNVNGADIEDSPKAWKAILDIKQSALKFTSLWVEYSQQDNTFAGNKNRYSIGGVNAAHVGANVPSNDNTTKMWFVRAKQQWNSKFSTFVRYAQADYGTTGLDDAKELGAGVGYQYTPAIYFELAYDRVDYGNSTLTDVKYYDKESVVRFRTSVSF